MSRMGFAVGTECRTSRRRSARRRQDLRCEGQSLDQMSIDDRHRWIVLIPASTLYLIHKNLVAQTNFKQPRPVLAGHKQTSAGSVVSDAVGHSFSVCAETFDVFGRRNHPRS